jgi:hypothetical protein
MYRYISGLLLITGAAYADSIAPSTFSAFIPSVGGTATVSKTVTITAEATSPIDLFFLTDTTGSMGGAIDNIQAGFSDVVTQVGLVASNVNYGAGQYKDFGDVFAYNLDEDLTANTAAVQAAINGWVASGGGDLPEANIFALEQVATTTSWRAGSQRILVWAGDAPGHDPSGGSTEASATAALIAAGVEVISIGATSGPGIDQTGQATRISNATGGSFLGSFNATTLVDEVLAALTTAITTYNTVDLMAVGLPAGVGVAFTPVQHSGAFDRSIDRTFDFDVTFTGLAPGTYNFDIAARVDGRIVALESDTIRVGIIPEPSTWLLMGGALIGLAAARKRLMNR